MPTSLQDETILAQDTGSTQQFASAEPNLYVMPATQGQGRFWALDQLEPGNPGLNMPLMWQFTGPLDLSTLQDAFSACIERHEMLRTTFEVVDGRLSQVIHEPLRASLPVIDLTQLSGETQRAEADLRTKQHAAMRMDLRRGPLLHLQLLRLGAERHLLLLNMHHIICDGISLGILMRDMLAFYEGALLEAPPQLPALPIQFGDYAVWQKEWRATEEAGQSREFWHRSLGREFRTVSLPQDALPATAMETTPAGDIETLLIPRDLQARANSFCLRENVTLNMLLFSVFVATVARVTGELAFTLGSPCANRTEDTEDLIGLFMNIQVFRSQLTPESSFRDLLDQVRTWTLGAYENQTLPFEDLIHDPFFAEGAASFQIPVFFLYQKSFMLRRRIGPLEVVPLRSESPGAVFDVMFAIVDREEEGPRLQLEFDPRKHAPSTVQRWLRLFVNLLESGIAEPDESVQRLHAIPLSERKQLLAQVDESRIDFGPFRSVPALFSECAQRIPDRIALQCDGREWTYAELLHEVLCLVQVLRDEGVQPGDLVAIAVERSMRMLVSVLATMFAGAAYVPLDPRHPRERLDLVLRSSNPKLLLQSSSVESGAQVKSYDVRSIPNQIEAKPRIAELSADSLAYVIYTSGTTGVPKGVAIEHGSLWNLLESMRREPGLIQSDVLVAVTTLSFDIAALELLLPLVTGAKVVLATDAQVADPATLLQLLRQSGATVMQATPGAWRALLDAGWTSSSLRVLCGGESMSRALADKLLERSSDVWNLYGPTETTIWSSATRVLPGTAAPRIGAPIANTQFYLLDENLEPVPAGFTGELFIGGAGVARGYWNNAALTTERFVSNPFGSSRLYKTGDLARRHADSTFELLGRADFQVKCRGFRIELGDIETALLRHGDVREAAVLPRRMEESSPSDEVQLIAFVEADGDNADDAAFAGTLTAYLKKILPEYMLPNNIVVMRELPRNTNGKVDRAALRLVQNTATPQAEEYCPPRDVIERQLCQLWQTTLGIPRISVRSSFFSLGVSSLAALRLVNKMNRTYATDLGLATLLSAPTIEAIAELIRTRLAPNTSSALVPIKSSGSRPPLFMVHGVGGNVISFHGLAMRLGPEQPAYGIQAQGLLHGEAGFLRLEDMAASYIRAMRAAQPHGPYHLLGYSFGGTVAMEMAHQLRASGEHVALLGMLDSKSTVYWAQAAMQQTADPARVQKRIGRIQGNTASMDRKSRVKYIGGKLLTRAARLSYSLGSRIGLRKVPAWMKNAEELNRVAINRYQLKPYEGDMVLFRATEQHDGINVHDLGWSGLFQDGITLLEIPGDHERLFLEPMVEDLARAIRKTLDDVYTHERTA